ncbi:MAG: winged helix-turn-helix domain-containing protein [Nitrososphaerota archaeon]|jgi:DNA-binding transcriptional ArsR family regulator|nr:winged helix-turn-helix domain-containing protein [Nitrososphaerota archaeon]
MSSVPDDEIYSIMFSSFKHPVRRKILRMLDSKPMTFMELVEALGISTPNLTYHLESLGELLSKLDNGAYKLSAFGQASISALKGVEDVHGTEPRRRRFALTWRAAFGVLLIVILLLAGFSAMQHSKNNQLLETQQILYAENQQLKSWGMGTDKVANFLHNVVHIDTRNYTIALLSNNLYWRTDFGGLSEEEAVYSLKGPDSNLNVMFRFRNNHFSRYELTMIESSPIFTQNEPNNLILNAHMILTSYQAYSNHEYLTDMLNLLSQVSSTQSTTITEGNMKLSITISGTSAELSWMFTENGIDYQTKGLQMTFQYNILTTMTDSYYLFQKGSSTISITQEQAIGIAEDYVKTMSYIIEGQSVSDFKTTSPPLSIQMVPHVRGGSVELYPYWYIELNLDKIYSGGLTIVSIGIYADTGQVADAQLHRGSIEL